MTAFLKPLVDSTGFVHGAVIADNRGAEHLWAPGIEPWFDSRQRLRQLIVAQRDERRPTEAALWLDMALFGISHEYTANSELTEYPTRSAAAAQAEYLFENNPQGPVTVTAADRAAMHDFVSAGGDPDDPQEVLSLVMSLLGPIDPDGPNGWLLKAAAGEEYDRDDAWIRWTPEGDQYGTPED